MYIEKDAEQRDREDRDQCQEDEGHPDIDTHAHDHGEDHHEWGTDCHPDEHLIRILDVCDVGRHSRDQRGR